MKKIGVRKVLCVVVRDLVIEIVTKLREDH